MYVYFEPGGGFNDILVNINKILIYCNIHNRILLVNSCNSHYKINFIDYFNFPKNNIIVDIAKIKAIFNNNNYTIYPEALKDKMNDVLNNKKSFKFKSGKGFFYDGVNLHLPMENRPETIIVHSTCGGGRGYVLFKELLFNINVKNICKERYNKLKKPYLCIQIRNTDYKCDYISYFEENKSTIHSFKEIYIATDEKAVLEFYKNKGLPIKNFTTFPKDDKFRNLHRSNVASHIKFIDLLCDIYIIGMSDKLLSNSSGGFIRLVREINENKEQLIKQFL